MPNPPASQNSTIDFEKLFSDLTPEQLVFLDAFTINPFRSLDAVQKQVHEDVPITTYSGWGKAERHPASANSFWEIVQDIRQQAADSNPQEWKKNVEEVKLPAPAKKKPNRGPGNVKVGTWQMRSSGQENGAGNGKVTHQESASEPAPVAESVTRIIAPAFTQADEAGSTPKKQVQEEPRPVEPVIPTFIEPIISSYRERPQPPEKVPEPASSGDKAEWERYREALAEKGDFREAAKTAGIKFETVLSWSTDSRRAGELEMIAREAGNTGPTLLQLWTSEMAKNLPEEPPPQRPAPRNHYPKEDKHSRRYKFPRDAASVTNHKSADPAQLAEKRKKRHMQADTQAVSGAGTMLSSATPPQQEKLPQNTSPQRVWEDDPHYLYNKEEGKRYRAALADPANKGDFAAAASAAQVDMATVLVWARTPDWRDAMDNLAKSAGNPEASILDIWREQLRSDMLVRTGFQPGK